MKNSDVKEYRWPRSKASALLGLTEREKRRMERRKLKADKKLERRESKR